MEEESGVWWWGLLLSDLPLQFALSSALALSLSTGFIFGTLSGLWALLAFGSGFCALIYLSQHQGEVLSVAGFVLKNINSKAEGKDEDSKCNVCGDNNCKRERIIHKQKPWAGLMVPKEVDAALQNLLEKTLAEFISSWYKNLSVDRSFPSELREDIRYAASVVLSRVLQINLPAFINHKLIPAAIQHVHKLRQLGKDQFPNFHPAVYNRKAELDYLRFRVKAILPHVMEKQNLECNIFTVLVSEILAGWLFLPVGSTAEPVVINSLLLLLLGNQPLTQYPPSKGDGVEFLDNFVKNEEGLHSNALALHPDLCTILKHQPLLYAFMQFLKDQGAVHILQFCLDVEEFNRRMLCPELSSEDLDVLYKDAWDLYSVYFSPHSPDNIGFNPELVIQMRKVLSKDVSKLRTSPPLFQAYEHAYSLLDKTYCPLFHSSDKFFTWLCGPRAHYNQKSGSNSSSNPSSPAKRHLRRGAEGTVSKLSNKLHKIKGALKSQVVLDGQIEDTALEADTEFAEDLTLIEEEEEERDLSSWRISITQVDARLDPTTGKLGPVYSIAVQRFHSQVGVDWKVERRLCDFYTLEAKLTEFHGDFPGTRLPPCGLLCPSPPTDASVYESYLQKLLSTPSLRGSDLLHWFLSSPDEFVFEDNGLGRLLRKSVPLTLRKERGQNLEHFITQFFSSTDIKAKKLEWKDYTHEFKPRRRRCLTNTVFKDNLGIGINHFPSDIEMVVPELLPKLSGPSDCLIYIGVSLLQLPQPLVKITLALHTYLSKPIDSLCNYLLGKKLHSLLVPQRLAHLIKLLQWVVYEKTTKGNPSEVAANASKKIEELKTWYKPLFQVIFPLVQEPVMNKQLFYTLLDLVLDEVFPETVKLEK